MRSDSGGSNVLEVEPANSDFLSQAVTGLGAHPRALPCKFFYDEKGSELFQKICDSPEYYVTRTELEILRRRVDEIAANLGKGIQLIGLGTGAGTKTRILVERLLEPVAYISVDISKEQLAQSTTLFRQLFPHLEILPVCADYLKPVSLPKPTRKATRKVVYFPGSTIGNFEPHDARVFLKRIQRLVGARGGLLIGVDLQKDRQILERAYNDSAGVTAEFNLNLLVRANRELGADFDLRNWRHRAIYNSAAGRIEMHLVSESNQVVHLADQKFRFQSGEKIITEYSYKYTPDGFSELAAQAGFNLERLWTDERRLFGVFYFTVQS